MRPLIRLRREPVELGGGEHTLIDRYLGDTHGARRARYDVTPASADLSGIGIELIDASEPSEPPIETWGGVVLWHVLWVTDEERSSVRIVSSEGDPEWPIAPGDTVPVPPGGTLAVTGGQLALAIALPDGDILPSAPTHGTDRYFGNNRRTVVFRASGYRLCRWKLTQPLALASHHPSPVIAMALARAVVIRAGTTIDRLAQGQAALIDPSAGPTVMPDGLAYLLTIDRDDAR